MIEHTFKSLLGDCINGFISQKRAFGYPYQSSARILFHFDALAAKQFPNEYTMTKEMCDAWLQLKPGEHPNGLLRRITPVRQLGKSGPRLKGVAWVRPIRP
jgi:hypothetical protein